MLFVLTIVSAIAIGLLFATQAKHQKTMANLAKDIAANRAVIDEILAWQRVRPVSGLSVGTIGGTRIKMLDGPIAYGVDVATAMSLKVTRADWVPKGPDDLPNPWSLIAGQRHVVPYEFAKFASILADKIKNGSMAKDAPQLRLLLDVIRRHSTVTSNTASFQYDFDLQEFGGFVAQGWRSAFGDAAIVMGLCELYEATRDPGLTMLARKYASSLVWSGQSTQTLFVDRAGYLWFEEYPLIGGQRTHVMNGHVFSIFALIRLSHVTNDRSFEPMIRAGLATAARHLLDIRNPGNTSYYNLGGKRFPDYGPERMIIFARTLREITGNPTFAAAEMALTTDE